MSERLSVCAGCERHVKRGDDVCPFCGSKQAPRMDGPAPQATARLSRAAILALGTGAVLVTTALGLTNCADAPVPPDDSEEGAGAGEGDSTPAPLLTSLSPVRALPPTAIPLYGSPPPEEVDAGGPLPPRIPVPPASAYGGPPGEWLLEPPRVPIDGTEGGEDSGPR
jgi:hypothetical protein